MMHKYIFITIIFFLISCEPDDICSNATQTTPRLIIEFYNIENSNELKTVPALFAVGLDADSNEINITNEIVSSRDRIELPLNGSVNSLRFKLYKNYDLIGGVTSGNFDIININYLTEFEFVSRSCGFMNKYIIEELAIEIDSDPWMNAVTISSYEVKNENITHVQIFH